MKNWTAYAAYALIWVSVSMAVSVGVYFTHSIHCLWFLLIPTTIRMSDKEEKRKEAENEDSY